MISTPIQIRFADVDMGGHVHNGAYLHYFETARIGFFLSEIPLTWDWKKNGLIVKKNTIEYHQPVLMTDQIHVEVSCNHIGTKSFTLTYHVYDAKNNLKTYGESVIVSINYLSNQTTEIPDLMQQILIKHFIQNAE